MDERRATTSCSVHSAGISDGGSVPPLPRRLSCARTESAQMRSSIYLALTMYSMKD